MPSLRVDSWMGGSYMCPKEQEGNICFCGQQEEDAWLSFKGMRSEVNLARIICIFELALIMSTFESVFDQKHKNSMYELVIYC